MARVGPQRHTGEKKKCHSVIMADSYSGGKKINQPWLWLDSVRLATAVSQPFIRGGNVAIFFVISRGTPNCDNVCRPGD